MKVPAFWWGAHNKKSDTTFVVSDFQVIGLYRVDRKPGMERFY